jgi:hypothetical protein
MVHSELSDVCSFFHPKLCCWSWSSIFPGNFSRKSQSKLLNPYRYLFRDENRMCRISFQYFYMYIYPAMTYLSNCKPLKDAKWCIQLHFGNKICVVKTLNIVWWNHEQMDIFFRRAHTKCLFKWCILLHFGYKIYSAFYFQVTSWRLFLFSSKIVLLKLIINFPGKFFPEVTK